MDGNQTARWMAGLAVAILLGGIAGYFLSGGGPEPAAPPAPQAPPPKAAAPKPEAPPAPPPAARGGSLLDLKDRVPAKPPPPRADLPFMRTAPGDEPEIEGDAKTRERILRRRLDEWTSLMAATRPDVRLQILEGKKQERDRTRKQLEEIQQALAASPGDAEALDAQRRLNDQIHYLDEAIERLESLQEEER